LKKIPNIAKKREATSSSYEGGELGSLGQQARRKIA
jgi:hypothetical protein